MRAFPYLCARIVLLNIVVGMAGGWFPSSQECASCSLFELHSFSDLVRRISRKSFMREINSTILIKQVERYN